MFASVAGGLSALGFAPFGLFPFLLAGFAALVLLIDGAQTRPRPIRSAAGAGFAFGFGQFLVGLHWIGYAFMVNPGAHEWQIPFVAVLFPGGLALFIALAAGVAAAFWREGPSRIFVLTVCYAIAEWLRGHILTGFPWNIAAYGWGASLAVLQSAALFGSYTLTLLTILFGASLAELFHARPKWILPAVMAGLFTVLWIGGEARLAVTPTVDVPGVRLRLVQPDVPQAEKYEPRYILRNWDRLVSLSEMPAKSPPTIIVWPEAAPPFLLEREPPALDQIAVLTSGRRLLMTGAIREQRSDVGPNRFYNSFFIFGSGGKLLATYDKFHLVPFGEYLPFEKTLDKWGLTKLTGIDGSFARGDGPHTYDVPGVPPVGPLICYEILFPGAVVGEKRPGWFVNVTDDSWFGPWAGPLQHLLVARMRAIEEGIPVARAANTGISAIIDPLGRITATLSLDRQGVVDGSLPAAIAHTLYSRFGDLWFWLFVSASMGLALMFSRGKLRN
ncbi:MAG: apolipoprotein N-acyltransferase [Alphaproteobacteria bacterium]|nr:apolipoprotein N-acyltransferase [Alphaproteobacteria bacterium]